MSNGTVQYTMRNLQHTGHVVALGGGGRGERRIERTGDLLDRWATGYADVLRPKLSLGWFRSLGAPDAVLGWRDVRLEPGEVWGGEPVAALLTDLRPARLTLYTRAPKPDVMQRLRVVPCAFEAGVLEILRPPWADEAERTLDTPFWTRASRVLALGDLRTERRSAQRQSSCTNRRPDCTWRCVMIETFRVDPAQVGELGPALGLIRNVMDRAEIACSSARLHAICCCTTCTALGWCARPGT